MPSRQMLTIIAAFVAFAGPAFAQQRICVEELAGTCLKWREEAPRAAAPASPAPSAAVSPEAAAERSLGLGAAERRAIQTGLNAEGLDAGAPDGAFGPRTRRAIAAFQRSRGEPATGFLTADQAVALRGAASPPAPETAGGATAPEFTSVSKFSGSTFRIFVSPADAGAMRLRLRVETFDAGAPFDQSCILSTQGRDECVLDQLQWHNVAVESAYPNVRLLFQPTLRRTNPWGPSTSPGLIAVTIE
ncbi:MAG: peptidoglycan-binding domain-containing protein [Pikeienuella sp.]|uniref:peptidoglycan-binding domain-containing protein n=1 Tax=Pikeienuella sp. TaxID=2831957 RepID=UPI00391A3504